MYDLMNTYDLLSGLVEGQDSWKKDYQAQEASAKVMEIYTFTPISWLVSNKLFIL